MRPPLRQEMSESEASASETKESEALADASISHNTPALEVEDLTVAYKDRPALWDMDLAIPTGVAAAIVGPNGAGKTTLLKAVLGTVPPVAGSVRLFGLPYAEASPRVGYVPHAQASIGIFPPRCSMSCSWARMAGSAGFAGRVPASARPRSRHSINSASMISHHARSANSPAASSSGSFSLALSCKTRTCT